MKKIMKQNSLELKIPHKTGLGGAVCRALFGRLPSGVSYYLDNLTLKILPAPPFCVAKDTYTGLFFFGASMCVFFAKIYIFI
jgi:hypothetical protein